MAPNDLPDDIKRLLREHISSVEQLDVLLLLRGQPQREFDARTVQEELRTSESSAATRLADLEARGFLTSRPDDDKTLFRYSPSSEWLRDTVEQLEHCYAERRYRVIELIFSKPIDNLRVFAGAFRFRKDDSDG